MTELDEFELKPSPTPERETPEEDPSDCEEEEPWFSFVDQVVDLFKLDEIPNVFPWLKERPSE